MTILSEKKLKKAVNFKDKKTLSKYVCTCRCTCGCRSIGGGLPLEHGVESSEASMMQDYWFT